MARAGKSYVRILKHYYRDVRIERLYWPRCPALCAGCGANTGGSRDPSFFMQNLLEKHRFYAWKTIEYRL